MAYSRMNVERLDSKIPISGPANATIGDFWAWAYSDIMSNTVRSIFAEFLVGTALNVIDQPRIEWDAVDLRYGDLKIEVKSSAYLQSWAQDNPSDIRFDIGEKKAWDASTNTYSEEPVRSAHCYVFCVFTAMEREQANVLDVAQWEFYIISTEVISHELKGQKSIGLARLQDLASPVLYEDIKLCVDRIANVA